MLLYLKDRKGFVKLAMEARKPVIPVYQFGGENLYGLLTLPKWLLQKPVFAKISRAIGFTPILMIGRFGIPFGI